MARETPENFSFTRQKKWLSKVSFVNLILLYFSYDIYFVFNPVQFSAWLIQA